MLEVVFLADFRSIANSHGSDNEGNFDDRRSVGYKSDFGSCRWYSGPAFADYVSVDTAA